MDKGGKVEFSYANICTLAVVFALLFGYFYILEIFYLENPVWVVVIFVLVFYLTYYLFREMNVKRKRVKEICEIEKETTFFWS